MVRLSCPNNSVEVQGRCKIDPSFHILCLCGFSPLTPLNVPGAKSFCLGGVFSRVQSHMYTA